MGSPVSGLLEYVGHAILIYRIGNFTPDSFFIFFVGCCRQVYSISISIPIFVQLFVSLVDYLLSDCLRWLELRTFKWKRIIYGSYCCI